MAETTDGPPSSNRLKHIRIDGFRSEEAYGPPQRDMSGMSSGRNRDVHGPKLEGELAAALVRAHELLVARDQRTQIGVAGVYLEVESAEGGKLPDLTWSLQNIRLGATRLTDAGAEIGTLFVPASSEAFLTEKVRQYARKHPEAGAQAQGSFRAAGNHPGGHHREPVDGSAAPSERSRQTDLVGVLVLARPRL